MKLDDVFGIIFLLLFIIGPALKGLLKPPEPLIEVEPPIEEAPPPKAAQPAGGKTEPVPPPAAAQNERRPRPQPEPSRPAAAPVVAAPAASGGPATVKRQRRRKLALGMGRRDVLRGMLWHEVLNEPVSRKLLKRRLESGKSK